MRETPPASSVDHEPPLFSELSDPRPQLFDERPASEALFDVRALQQPPPGPRFRAAPRQVGSGLIDLFALTDASNWNRDEKPIGTLVDEVSRSDAPVPAPTPTSSEPSRVRRWLLPGVTAVCTTAGLFALMI